MNCFLAGCILWCAPIGEPNSSDAQVANELKNDVVLRALVDELHRNKDRLSLEGMAKPYFIEYGLVDGVSASVSATLGAVTTEYSRRFRSFRTDVRVGSYKLDNTNFQGDYGDYFDFGGESSGAAIPIEDDYAALRQAIWWASDRDYKGVTETLERKKAFMASKMIEDKPDDFSCETPSVHFEERRLPPMKLDGLKSTVVSLSELFRKYPAVQSSSASFNVAGGNTYLVNTEGTTVRANHELYTLSVWARVQADDGMTFDDSFTLYAHAPDGLPSLDKLSEKARSMIDRLVRISKAPKLESYTGPVLFDGKAVAKTFAQVFGARFCGGQRPVGGSADVDDFEKKIEQRILPKFMSVVDDPSKTKIDDEIVIGHYDYDDQGVKGRPVRLVEKGRLKGLLMSRNPSKKFKKSNGHGRGLMRPATGPGCLIVSVEGGETDEALKKRLLEACKDEGLEFGLRLTSMERGATPLEMYKVYPDGREELVRGAQVSRLELKSFKKVLAAGEKLSLVNSGGLQGRTIATPAMLFEELDLAKIDEDFDKPPIIETPLARKG